MKKNFLLLFLAGSLFTAKAQFSHSVGASLFLVSANQGISATSWGITYYPRYTVSSSFSVGVPLSLGLAGSYNSQDGASSGSSITVQLPIVADYNYGLGSSEKSDDSKFGFYVGAGLGYFSTTYTDDLGGGSVTATGPYAHSGIRFNIKDHAYDFGASYHAGLSGDKASIIGIRLLYAL